MSFSRKETEEYEHHESYYFCNIIKNVLNEQGAYMRGLNDYLGDGRSVAFNLSFPKWSHFHDFIGFIIDSVYAENLDHENLKDRLEAFKRYKPSFSEPIDVAIVSFVRMRNYFQTYLSQTGKSLDKSGIADLEDFLCGFYEGVLFQDYKEKTIKEVFYILFGNRSVLKLYNEMIAEVRESDWDPEFYNSNVNTRNGYLRRVTIPKWVQKAVYHRDKGRCVICKKDVTGMINIYNKSNYDHIVPLARFGINDVSNIQLLCDTCNQQKKANNNNSSKDYFPWYRL
ncbi:HNH endonuclease [Enterobacteriaceae bacterium RIT814]|nr:HNH endonuclease [Enterobacteriaceae bacterium RIT 814]